jgi:L-rhamnose isomerase
MEEQKTLPFGAVWDYHCLKSQVPISQDWLQAVKAYEADVLAHRSQLKS